MKSTERLATWLKGARFAVAFTGAGISTESGIPDFRSPGGVWSKYQPVYFDAFMASVDSRREYWRQKCEAHAEFANAVPNVGHRVLAAWERSGTIVGVVTQNIDGLHQLAGCDSVLEIHGTAREAECMHCHNRLEIQPLVDQFNETRDPPNCEKCGGPLKHATISFGQPLNEPILRAAQSWMEATDLVIALGSSLAVQPAASLPQLAKSRGARFVIVNRDPTPLDEYADLVIHRPLGETLASVNALIDDAPDH